MHKAALRRRNNYTRATIELLEKLKETTKLARDISKVNPQTQGCFLFFIFFIQQ
jgi:hypothetical protein